MLKQREEAEVAVFFRRECGAECRANSVGGVSFNAGLGECGAVAFEAAEAVDVRGGRANETDATVAECDEVRDCVECALVVVGSDAVDRRQSERAADGGECNALRGEAGECVVADLRVARGDKEAVDAMVDEGLDGGPLFIDTTRGCGDERVVSSGLQHGRNAPKEFGAEGVGDIGKQDADGVETAAAELAREHVRAITEGGGGCFDALQNAGADVAGTVESARGRHGNDAGHGGDVGERRWF